MRAVLTLENVRKEYAGHTAVDDLSLSVAAGAVHGLLGPNGAGKSTTIRMVMSILSRDGGTISVLGTDPARDKAILRRVGYLPEERGLYRDMTVLDVIVLFGRLKGLGSGEAKRRGRAWLERMGLDEWADEKMDTLSKGMQQKVQFITTVLHDPDLLILDEPQSGLDPVNQDVLARIIRELREEGRAVILSTHNMQQAEAMCDAVTIIAGGRKVLEGDVTALRRRHRHNRFRVQAERPDALDLSRLNGAASGVVRRGETVEFDLRETLGMDDLLRFLAGSGVPVVRVEHVEPSLHEIFIELVGETAGRARRGSGASREEALHA